MISETLLDKIFREPNAHSGNGLGVKRVIEAMNGQLDKTLALQDMADIASFSPFHFNRIFRQATGIPPTQFLYALRIQEAKRLLLTTQLRVTDICYEVGYTSLGTFTRRFTELVGISPTKLRTFYEDPGLLIRESHSRLYFRPVQSSYGGCISGKVSLPAAFAGFVFIGIFPTPIPQNQPIGCAILTMIRGQETITYEIETLPAGRCFAFAAAYSSQFEPAYVGTGQKPALIQPDQPTVQVDIPLRISRITDPPVLFAPPYLFARFFEGRKTISPMDLWRKSD